VSAEAIGAPYSWASAIHSLVYLATAPVKMAGCAGFEPLAVLIAMTAGSEVRGPMLRSSKAMALAPASRSGLPSPEPSRPARCPSPSVEGECCPYPAEHFAWGSAVLAAWRSCLVRGLLHRFGDVGCRPHPAERDPAER